MMVSETAVASVIVDVHLRRSDFYRQRHRIIFGAVHSLHSRGEPVDALTVTEQLTNLGELPRRAARSSSPASRRPSPSPATRTTTPGSSRRTRCCAASLGIAQDPELGPRAQRRAARPRRAGRAHDVRGRARHGLAGLRARSRTSSSARRPASRSSPRASGTSREPRRDSRTSTRSPAASSPETSSSSRQGRRWGNPRLSPTSPTSSRSRRSSRSPSSRSRCRRRSSPTASWPASAGIRGDKLRKGQVKNDWNRILKASNQLENAPIWIDTSCRHLDPRAAREGAPPLLEGGRPRAVIVDYMQLMRADDPRMSRVEQVGSISRGLKLLAGELDVPVLALSQLSRAPEQRPDKKPMLSDLRESGNLEQDADVVCFIFRAGVLRAREPGRAGQGGAHHRQAPQRADRQRRACLPGSLSAASGTCSEPRRDGRAREQRAAAPRRVRAARRSDR